MLSIAHTLTSLPLGVYLNNPVLIFAAAFVLHLLLDTVLHWNIYPEDLDKYPFVRIFIDVFGGLALAYILLGSELFSLPILLAIAGGNAPDALHQIFYLLPSKYRRARWIQHWYDFEDHIQLETYKILPGLFWQVVASIIAIAVIV